MLLFDPSRITRAQYVCQRLDEPHIFCSNLLALVACALELICSTLTERAKLKKTCDLRNNKKYCASIQWSLDCFYHEECFMDQQQTDSIFLCPEISLHKSFVDWLDRGRFRIIIRFYLQQSLDLLGRWQTDSIQNMLTRKQFHQRKTWLAEKGIFSRKETIFNLHIAVDQTRTSKRVLGSNKYFFLLVQAWLLLHWSQFRLRKNPLDGTINTESIFIHFI